MGLCPLPSAAAPALDRDWPRAADPCRDEKERVFNPSVSLNYLGHYCTKNGENLTRHVEISELDWRLVPWL